MEQAIRISKKYQKKFNTAKTSGKLTKSVFIPLIKNLQQELQEVGLKFSDHECIKIAYGNIDIVINEFL